MESLQDCHLAAQETLLINNKLLNLTDYYDISREYKDARNALNVLSSMLDGAEMIMQLHLGEQFILQIPSSTET